jgi:FKBP-type peptidyl-prolyl cis-trans isomerase
MIRVLSLSNRGRSLALGAGLAVAILAQPGAAEVKPDQPTTPASFPSEEARAAYALGLVVGRGFSVLALSEEEYAQFLNGLRDERAGAPRLTLPQELKRVEAFQQQRTRKRIERESEIEKAFLEEARKRPKVEPLPYGAVFEPLAPGKGDPPKLGDVLTFRYSTHLPDGSLVDSSEWRGAPERQPLERVPMQCWSQALLKMGAGAKARLSCPAVAAYGEAGLPPIVPPASAVRFDLELVSIERAKVRGGHP